jgi:predicted NBD/HSP70 family sugar kinase
VGITDADVNHTGDATLLRKVNESAVLEQIRRHGPLTRSNVARQLHLSLPTITRIANALLDTGLIIESSTAGSSGGRRPGLLAFNARANLIIGVYVGHKMVAALADLDGEIIERHSETSLAGAEGLQQLIGIIQSLRGQADDLGLSVRGVGVGAPSIVSFPEGVVAWAPGLGWRNLPLKKLLETALGLPVFVENEVNLLALGESWRGAGRGIRRLACISVGTGIGAGLILDGQLYRGARGAAGEIGYIVPNEGYLRRQVNGFGALETLADRNALVARGSARLRAGDASTLNNLCASDPGKLTAEMVLEAARVGDPLAGAAVSEVADYLSIAIANLACVIDPERVVLSGDLAAYADMFTEPVRERIQGLVPAMPEIVASVLGMDAAVLGAVAIAMRETSDALFVQPSRA